MNLILRGLRLAATLGLLCPLLVASACSSDAAGPPLPEVTEATFLQQVSSLVCQRRAQCACSDQGNPTLPLGDGCEAAATALYQKNTTGLTFDGSCAVLFLDEYRRSSACGESPLTVFNRLRCVVGCNVYSGPLQEGQACTEDGSLSGFASPCSGTLRCNYSPNGVGQSCQASCPREENERCGYGSGSNPGFFGSCRSGLDCRSDPSAGSDVQVCLPRAGVGALCASSNCASGLLCDCPGGDSLCDYNTRVCQPRPSAGQSCRNGVCQPDSFCDTTPPNPVPPEGFTPVCKLRWADGIGCSGFEQCQSGFCPDGVCRRRPAVGEPCPDGLCGGNLVCSDGLCVGATGNLCYSN